MTEVPEDTIDFAASTSTYEYSIGPENHLTLVSGSVRIKVFGQLEKEFAVGETVVVPRQGGYVLKVSQSAVIKRSRMPDALATLPVYAPAHGVQSI